MRLTELQHVYCTTFPRPEAMEPGKLYISHKFKLANHLCTTKVVGWKDWVATTAGCVVITLLWLLTLI